MRTRSLVKRIVRQFLHDKRSLALMTVAPLLILWLVSCIFNGNSYTPKIGVFHVPGAFVNRMEQAGVRVTTYVTEQSATDALRSEEVDAFIQMDGLSPVITLEGSDPSKSKAILAIVQKNLQVVSGGTNGALNPEIKYLYGSANMTSFDNFGPVLIGVFAFFFVFIIAGIAFLKERTSGTLERLMATPLRRWEIVVGYVAGFGVFTTIQACLIAWFSVDVLGMMMNGSLLYLLLVTFLLSMTALTLGTFLSAFANSEFQMIQFIPIVIVPQVFFSGLFSVDNMATWMQGLSKFMPLYYGADALRNVMIRGKGFAAIYPDLVVLAVLSLCFMAANVVALRKYRKI